MKKYFQNKAFLAGSIMLGSILLVMLAGIIHLPYNCEAISVTEKLQGFSLAHIFGTDNLGRDILSRIMVGIRISLAIGFIVMIAGLTAGLILGSLSGWFGGITDTIIMKFISTLMSFPGILMALMLIAVFGTDIKITIIAISIMSVPRYTRITRSGFIKYKNSLFVKAAKTRGASSFRIMYIHILPNIITELIVTATLTFSLAVLSESGLSYLGLGVQPPHPSFGRMINDAQNYIFANPSGVIVPVLFLIILVLGLNLIGEGISQVNRK